MGLRWTARELNADKSSCTPLTETRWNCCHITSTVCYNFGMNRERRWRFNFTASVSLLAWAAILLIWVRSYQSPWTTSIIGDRGDFRLLMVSDAGEFQIGETHQFEVWHVAYWKLCILLLIAPARWVQRRSAHRARARIGYCSICGYDLRATPERCPECGTVPSREAAAPRAWTVVGPRWILLLIGVHTIASYGTFGGMIAYLISTREVPVSELPTAIFWLIGTIIWPFRPDMYSLGLWSFAMYLGIASASTILLRSRFKRGTIEHQPSTNEHIPTSLQSECVTSPPVNGPVR